MNAKHVRMNVAVCLALVITGCDAKKERAPDPLQQQWMQVQNYFEVIRLIDFGHDKEALATYKRLADQNVVSDRAIFREFSSGDTNKARTILNIMIDGWIIQEACHSQHPPLTVLLDSPDRLRFLANLGVYREEHSILPFDAEVDKRVAEILMEARRRISKKNTD